MYFFREVSWGGVFGMEAAQFGAKLRLLREQAGLSQKQLADKAGLSQKAVSFWETGEREPGWSAVQALAAALGVDCRAFQLADAEQQPPRGRGRPSKAEAQPADEEPARRQARTTPATPGTAGRRRSGSKEESGVKTTPVVGDPIQFPSIRIRPPLADQPHDSLRLPCV